MKLALQIPFGIDSKPTPVSFNPVEAKFAAAGFKLSDALNAFAEVAIYTGAFLMFVWAAWGVFDYIRAEGNKESLAKARKRIQWAIAGFIILLMAFFLSDFLKSTLFRDSNDTFYDIGGRRATIVQ